jgi:aconitate decarboxylase
MEGAVFGPPAAAAAVSKQLRLSPRQIEDAFGTACTQACGLMSAQFEAAAKRMQHGFAARNGLFAALLAKDNYTGIDQVFEREYGGYLDMFSQGTELTPQNKPWEIIQGLGAEWSSLWNISIKPYASMAGTHGPTDCILSLQAKHPERFSDLKKIEKVSVVQHKAW